MLAAQSAALRQVQSPATQAWPAAQPLAVPVGVAAQERQVPPGPSGIEP
jgi:hypothetical protein